MFLSFGIFFINYSFIIIKNTSHHLKNFPLILTVTEVIKYLYRAKHSVKDNNGFEIGLKRDLAKVEEVLGANKLCYYKSASLHHVLYGVRTL
jgi:hypothetical protein